jgi:serine/threonine-protein kinase
MYRLQAAFRPMRPDCPVIDLKIASNVVADGSEATEPRSKPLIVPGFEILEELGKGGMGVVYKARHLKLNRSVALKMILETNHHDPELLVRFVAEAKVIAQLEHPNIVHIFEIGRHDDHPYFTMEYVGGGTLAQKINGTPLPPHQAAQLVEQLAGGIHSVHQRGIVHRDLKPENVLMTPDGTPKITDFGLAKRVDAVGGLTVDGKIMGTPSYMAPEQAAGRHEDVNPVTDVYALGAILYECLSGRPPFRAATIDETLLQVRTSETVALRRLNRAVPVDLETICHKCLHKEPEGRYVDAEALSKDLRRFAEGRPIEARRASSFEKGWRWCRREPAKAGLVTAICLSILSTVIAGLWYIEDRAGRERDRLLHEAEVSKRKDLARLGIRQALDQTERSRSELITLLHTPGGVFELLNRSEAWEAKVKIAETSLEKGEELCRNNEDESLAEQVKEVSRLRTMIQNNQADRILAEKLEQIRLDKVKDLVRNRIDNKKALQRYSIAFKDASMPIVDRILTATKISLSPIKEQLVASLDDWAFSAFSLNEDTLAEQILAVARSAAPDSGWGDRFRQIDSWRDRNKLAELERSGPPDHLSPQMDCLVAELLPATNIKTEDWLRKARSKYPGDFWLNFELANTLLKASKHEEAAGYYRIALIIRPQTSAVYLNMGIALYYLKNPLEAIHALNTAINLDPKFAFAYNNLGIALLERGNTVEAINAFNKAIEIEPSYDVAYYHLGKAFLDQQKPTEAVGAYRKAVDLRPTAGAYIQLGKALRENDQAKDAVSAYRQATVLDPMSAVAYYNLGNVLSDLKRQREAITAYKKSIDIFPQLSQAYNNIGKLYHDQMQFQEAITWFCMAIKSNPSNATSHYNLIMALRAESKSVEVGDAYHRAIDEIQTTDNKPYNAARNALLAAMARDNNVSQFDASFRIMLRKQALDWLSGMLRSLEAAIDKPIARADIKEMFRLWQTDTTLKAVREEAELVKMTDSEQANWKKFWADVAAIQIHIEELEKKQKASEH